MSLCRLKGKTAIVTGGGSGIGRATCQLFAKEGANVAIVDINKTGAEESLRGMSNEDQTHCVIEADVSNSDDVRRVFTIVEKMFATKCTILVNCAGIIKRRAFFGELSEKDFDDTMNVNLKSTYLMSKEYVLSLKDVDAEVRGTMVNISSINARGKFCRAEYSASKAAIIALTNSIAKEFSQHKIRANVLIPGGVDTPMTAGLDEEATKATRKEIPMGRRGKPEEIANACLFLASNESSYVNGASLDITGGW